MEIVRPYGLKIVTLSVALAFDEHEKTRVNLRSLGTVPYASSLLAACRFPDCLATCVSVS